jgi:citrate lyase subunit beta / citryl-CoA lyase
LRRSKLITPADNWGLMRKAAASAADIIHLEVEDGVLAERKEEARQVCLRAMREIDWRGKELWVRVNHFDSGLTEADVDVLVVGRPNIIQLAKVQGPEDMLRLDAVVTEAEQRHGLPVGEIKLAAVLERVRALARVEEIALCTPRMGCLLFGIEDMANEYRYRQTREPGKGFETLYARSRMVLAARVAGIDILDAPFVRYKDLEGTEVEARFSAQLGFDGKSAVSPGQLEIINRVFAPSEKEVVWAREVMQVSAKGHAAGTAVWSVDGMMVDAPHILQAERILARAGLAA